MVRRSGAWLDTLRRLAPLFVAVASSSLTLGCGWHEGTASISPTSCPALCGTVRDAATGEPVEQFSLHLFDAEPAFPAPQFKLPPGYPAMPGQLVTSEDVASAEGRFDIPAVNARKLVIGISAAGYLSFQSDAIEIPADEPLEIRLERAWRAEGRVVDEKGTAVAGAEFFYDSQRRELPGRGDTPLARSDESGHFTLGDLQKSSSRSLVIVSDGFLPGRIVISPIAELTRLDVRLERGNIVSGAVKNSRGHPVARAAIEIIPRNGEGRMFYAGPDGRFKSPPLPAGKSRVRASTHMANDDEAHRVALGGLPAELEIEVPAAHEVQIVLPPTGTIRGRLVGLARIDSSYRLTLRCSGIDRTVKTGSDGTFQVTVAPGPCDLGGSYGDGVSHFVTDNAHVIVNDGETVVTELAFANPFELRVTSNGDPISTQIAMTPDGSSAVVARGRSGTDGTLRMAGLPSGKWNAALIMGDRRYEREIEIGSAKSFAIDLRTSDAELTIVDSAGRPLAAGITIERISPESGQPMPFELRFLDGGNGRYVAKSVVAGAYDLSIESRGYVKERRTIQVPGEPLPITLRPIEFPFPHPSSSGPSTADEIAILSVVARESAREAREFWKDAKQPRGRLVLVDQTTRARSEIGSIYGEDLATEQLELDQTKRSGAYAELLRDRGEIRSLAPLGGIDGILLQSYSKLPQRGPAEWASPATEVDVIDGEAFYVRYPNAAGLLMLSRPALSPDGREALVYVSRMMVLSIEGTLVRLKRHDGGWKIESSVILYSMPGCLSSPFFSLVRLQNRSRREGDHDVTESA